MKRMSNSISVSAILSSLVRTPLLMICFSRTGSSMGSTSFSMPSITTAQPSWSGSFSLSLSCGLLMLMMRSFFSRSGSRFLIHDMAWPCGSIISGYRDDLVTMMAFWMDRSSDGRPCKFHSPTVASSTKNDVRAKSSEHGIERSIRSLWKYSSNKICLNSALNGPQYDTNAHALATSPTSLLLSDAKLLASCSQRLRSSLRPLMRRLAWSIFLRVLAALSCSFCFSSI
mmetsp:Transcript_8591/g.9748  ORF Transcript_8591/g.9748 Transcript_8591/m.9748 type:complete len:228 (+) Transcript_8591:3063-3746(+)